MTLSKRINMIFLKKIKNISNNTIYILFLTLLFILFITSLQSIVKFWSITITMIVQKRIDRIFKHVFLIKFENLFDATFNQFRNSIFFSFNIIINDIDEFEMLKTSQFSQHKFAQLKKQIRTKYVFQQTKRANVVKTTKFETKLKKLL